MTPRAFGFRISVTYALLMIGSGVQLPFLPLWLKAKDIPDAEVALILAGMMATRILGAPLFAWIADHFGNRRLVIQLCAGFGFATYLALAISNGFGPIMTLSLIAAFMVAPVFPLMEGFAVDGSAVHQLDYGRLRLWASLSFLSGSLLGGALLTVLPPLDAAWILAAAQGVSLAATFIVPDEPAGQRAPSRAPTVGGARELFFASSFPLLMLVAGLGQASHGMLYSFSSVDWTVLGISSIGIGVLWTVAVLAEVTLFAFSNTLLARLGPARLLLIGLGGGVLRWLLMAFVTYYPALLATQALHALSFAAAHLGAMHFIRHMVPTRLRNRAQGLYSAISGGVFLSATVWLSGHLYAAYGGKTYLVMAAISAAALALALGLIRFSPRVRQAGAA